MRLGERARVNLQGLGGHTAVVKRVLSFDQSGSACDIVAKQIGEAAGHWRGAARPANECQCRGSKPQPALRQPPTQPGAPRPGPCAENDRLAAPWLRSAAKAKQPRVCSEGASNPIVKICCSYGCGTGTRYRTSWDRPPSGIHPMSGTSRPTVQCAPQTASKVDNRCDFTIRSRAMKNSSYFRRRGGLITAGHVCRLRPGALHRERQERRGGPRRARRRLGLESGVRHSYPRRLQGHHRSGAADNARGRRSSDPACDRTTGRSDDSGGLTAMVAQSSPRLEQTPK